MEYTGYKLVDKIMLVCKEPSMPDTNQIHQAYLVDPANKNQLESARHWAAWRFYGPRVKNEQGNWDYEYITEHAPLEYTFENRGFTLELLDCAGGSSQGGKLSFWNCIVKKDGHTFKIGINSDMLLNLLKDSTFDHGKCLTPLSFITNKGKVGMTIEGSDTWKMCLKDAELRAEIKAKATSKFSFGDKICTATIDELYLGTITQYYSFQYKRDRNRSLIKRECVLTKLAKPVTHYLIAPSQYWDSDAHKNRDYKKLSDVVTQYLNCDSIYSYSRIPEIKKSCPRRVISDKLELDISEEAFKEQFFIDLYDYDGFTERNRKRKYSYYAGTFVSTETLRPEQELGDFLIRPEFGFGFKPFDLDTELMNKIKAAGITYIDETVQ